MSPDNEYVSIHPAIQREFDYVKEECQGRHERTNTAVMRVASMAQADRDLLIELAGRSGDKGRVGAMEKAIEVGAEERAALAAAQHADHADLAMIKKGQFQWAGVGGLAGGGSIAGLVKLLEWVL